MAGMSTVSQYAQWSTPVPHQTEAPHNVHSSVDEVRTIFVLGFPRDVKERELQNLLRWWPGYEASQLTFKGDQPMGFALFSTAATAVAACDALQNLVFDAETNSVLRAEMAKKNLYVKRGVTGITTDIPSLDQSKRMRTGGDFNPNAYAVPGVFVPAAPPIWGPQGYVSSVTSYDPYGRFSMPAVQPVGQSAVSAIAPAGYAPVQNIKDNPPCNTLFIGNLGEATTEAELRGIFSSRPGFRQMKVLRQGKSTVCFIEFLDVNNAMAVHNSLQGALLSSSDRGGIRIQYSKNPFGKKKEGTALGTQTLEGDAAGVVNGSPGVAGKSEANSLI
eukprot:c20272_g1_i1 orf=522-1514(+)